MTTKKEALAKLINRLDTDTKSATIRTHPESNCWGMIQERKRGEEVITMGATEHYDLPPKPVPDGEWAMVWDEDEADAVVRKSTGTLSKAGWLQCYYRIDGSSQKWPWKNWKHLVVKNDD